MPLATSSWLSPRSKLCESIIPARSSCSSAGTGTRGARIIINGDSGDHEAVRDTMAAMHAESESVCGLLSLKGLVALLARSSLLVSNDSGPFHLASALDLPAVGLFWCGNVLTYGPLTSRRTAVHVSWRTNCPVCGVFCVNAGCKHQDSFVAEIPTEEVTASAVELFTEGTGI